MEEAIIQDAVVPTAPGTPFAGGFYVGKFFIGADAFALIVAPRADGEHSPAAWNTTRKRVDGAISFFDGLGNTEMMAVAGSKIAAWARELRIGGFDDWYLPARDELELIYRNLKPGTGQNACWSGDNPSSIPPGFAYMPAAPAQTAIEAFRAGGVEALADDWYWSSTQYVGAAESAWCQYFRHGNQRSTRKRNELRARAVRRLPI